MRPKNAQKKYRQGLYHYIQMYIKCLFSISSTVRMKMFHTEYYWRPLKHLAYFVVMKKDLVHNQRC